MEREIHLLKDWKFAFGDRDGLKASGRWVKIPHTWNVEEGLEDSEGSGWYQYDFWPQEEWKDKTVQVRFQAVSFDAEIFLNDQKVGEHLHSGYTPFSVDLTEYLVYGEANSLIVRADNAYSPGRLPYMRSFDWSNDGGIIREVQLIVTGKTYVKSIQVSARPVIPDDSGRQDAGGAVLELNAVLGGEGANDLALEWELAGDTVLPGEILYSGRLACADQKAVLPPSVLENIVYWHFDSPVLYKLNVKVIRGSEIMDTVSKFIGFRDFHVEGSKFYLNGEAVRVCGTEWMPGSNPVYGAAEPVEQLEKMLECLKASNCVFTRFHWQQDDAVYDWCDRHGMLVQEEVPFWGKDPLTAGDIQFDVFCQQAREMTEAHGSHPSIVSWGVGNELDAQADDTLRYIKDAVAYMKSLDRFRPVNYISNTFWVDQSRDGTNYGDFLMINEYAGTWMPDLVADEQIQKMLKAAPDKPLVPSEFGLCEPAFAGGDQRREEIFLEKMITYRKYPEVAGTIYFCLNDYRTQMGEEGEGKLRRRVHGSTDLDGTPKPSYYAVQRECAPFVMSMDRNLFSLTCRNDLPCYAMKGYTAEVLSDNGELIRQIDIPDMIPGMTLNMEIPEGDEIRVYRPTKAVAGVWRIQKS